MCRGASEISLSPPRAPGRRVRRARAARAPPVCGACRNPRQQSTAHVRRARQTVSVRSRDSPALRAAATNCRSIA